jgi:Mlc titration factor MtfA (ptsG expression regulator)
MPPAVDRFALFAATALGAGVALFALPFAIRGAWWASPALGVLTLLVVYLLASRRSRRRRVIAARVFPEPWRQILDRDVGYFAALGTADRARFEREIAWFLAEQHLSAPKGAIIDDETRLLVAASAVIVSFGRPGFVWPKLRDVVVYPDAFDDQYQVARTNPVLGMVHGQGPVILSARALRRGFKKEHDGENVGIHELAHVLDFEAGQADGVPSLMPWGSIEPWVQRMRLEITRVKKKRSLLRRYAATNEAEFFAVATEAFFERPRALRARHPELYGLLAETFGQDPASREPSPGASR